MFTKKLVVIKFTKPFSHFVSLLSVFIVIAVGLSACTSNNNANGGASSAGNTDGTKNLVVGIVQPLPRSDLENTILGFKSGMEKAGYTEGKNITYLRAANPQTNIDDLLAANVNLIYCVTTSACQLAAKATENKSIPVVFTAVSDPVSAKLVKDWKVPGGNVTGVASFAPGIPSEGRRLELLKALDPRIKTVFLPYNPTDPVSVQRLNVVKDAATKLNIELSLLEVKNEAESATMADKIPADANAVLVFSERAFTPDSITKLSQAATKMGIPTSQPNTLYGATMTYSPDSKAIGEQSAHLVDQLLRGTADAATLPVETAQFFFTINMPAVQAINLAVPDSILRQADQIIRQ